MPDRKRIDFDTGLFRRRAEEQELIQEYFRARTEEPAAPSPQQEPEPSPFRRGLWRLRKKAGA
jgi:hypothetical protein